jgi:Mrp family chromosome partitioning ATPase
VLNRTATLDQVLVKDPSGAMILPLARSAYTPKDVFGTAAMRALIEELRRTYDVIVLDTAPVLPIADTRVLAPLADSVVVLVRWRKTPRKATEAALRMLQSVHAHIAGAALTQVNVKAQAQQGYGDPGYYYRSYQKYYGG